MDFRVFLKMMLNSTLNVATQKCCAPLLDKCPQHHGHKGDPVITPGTCGAVSEKAQVILVWMKA
jgi:hypothetical protein